MERLEEVQASAGHYFNAASILSPQVPEGADFAPDRLLLFQLPSVPPSRLPSSLPLPPSLAARRRACLQERGASGSGSSSGEEKSSSCRQHCIEGGREG